MRNLLLCFFVLFMSSNALAQNRSYERHWDAAVQKVRIISYNIFNGFDWGKDKDREERFVSWVKESQPDILALQELCGFTEKKLADLAQQWGHSYVAIVKEDGYPVGITSRRPIEVKAKLLEGVGHGLLHVDTYGLELLVTHLNPHDVLKRRAEAAKITKYIEDQKLTKYIVMGDLNAHSPADADRIENSRKDSENVDYSVISRFLAVPLVDICRRYVEADSRHTFPTPILMTVSKQESVRKRSSERIDFILLQPDLLEAVSDAFIYNGSDTDYLSDHYPIGVDLVLPAKD